MNMKKNIRYLVNVKAKKIKSDSNVNFKTQRKALSQNKEHLKWKNAIRILKKGLEIYNLGKDVASFLSLFVLPHLGVKPMIDNLIDDLTSFRIVFVLLALCYKKIKALIYLYQKTNPH